MRFVAGVAFRMRSAMIKCMTRMRPARSQFDNRSGRQDSMFGTLAKKNLRFGE